MSDFIKLSEWPCFTYFWLNRLGNQAPKGILNGIQVQFGMPDLT